MSTASRRPRQAPIPRARALRRVGVALLLGALVAVGCSSEAGTKSATSTTVASKPVPLLPLQPTGGGYSAAQPLALHKGAVGENGNSEVTHITYASPHDVRVPALLMQPRIARNPHPCVIVQHGLGGSKDDAQAVFGALSLAGMGGIAIDARLHGERGNSAERTVAAAHPRQFAEMLQGTIVDLRRAADVLVDQSQCDRKRISFIGLSLGGFLGIPFSAIDARIQSPAFVGAGGNWVDVLQATSLGIAGPYKDGSAAFLRRAHRELDPFDPARWIAKIAPRSVMLVHGERDDVVVPATARDLQDAALQPEESYWYDGGHVPEGANALKVIGVLTNWFVGHLR